MARARETGGSAHIQGCRPPCGLSPVANNSILGFAPQATCSRLLRRLVGLATTVLSFTRYENVPEEKLIGSRRPDPRSRHYHRQTAQRLLQSPARQQ